MKKIYFSVSDGTLSLIQQNGCKKLRGRVWLEVRNGTKHICFEPYQIAAKRRMRVLHQAPFGRLNESANSVNLTLSVPKRIGLHRAADILYGNAKESSDALHQMADSELKSNSFNTAENE